MDPPNKIQLDIDTLVLRINNLQSLIDTSFTRLSLALHTMADTFTTPLSQYASALPIFSSLPNSDMDYAKTVLSRIVEQHMLEEANKWLMDHDRLHLQVLLPIFANAYNAYIATGTNHLHQLNANYVPEACIRSLQEART